jgi:hypothetical protein
MKKILSAVALVAMLGTGSAALAQTSPEVQTSLPNNSYEALLAAIPGSGSSDLSSIASQDQVVIVEVSTLETGSVPASDIDNALATNEAATASLRENISVNEFITGKLEADGYSVEDVIAIYVDTNGVSATLYVDDRM